MSLLTLDINSPYDGTKIASINMHNGDDAKKMLEIANSVFKNRDAWLSAKKRIEILNKLAKLVEDEADDFAMLIAQEGGKPLQDAKAEVIRAIDGIKLAAEELEPLLAETEMPMQRTKAAQGKKAVIRHEPIGVVFAISAFNHPLNLIIHQIIPAIAVGCPVIVKPSSSTPLNCLRLVELVHQAGLPEEWCQICVCDNEVSEEIATSNKIAFLSFIGSAKVGWHLKSKLAAGVRCALEHGGVAPVIIDKTANIEKAVSAMLKGGFYHAGQVCVSVQKIFIHEEIIDEVAKSLCEGAEKLVVGDATKSETEIGPLIKTCEVERVHEWVEEAVSSGAKLLTGGKKLSETTYAPTILLEPNQNAKVSTLEVFGPVVCLYSYENISDAVDQANSLEFAFQAAVFSEDSEIIETATSLLEATAIMVNEHTAFRVDWMPFGGRKKSGYGLGGIGYSMRDMMQIKLVVTNGYSHSL